MGDDGSVPRIREGGTRDEYLIIGVLSTFNVGSTYCEQKSNVHKEKIQNNSLLQIECASKAFKASEPIQQPPHVFLLQTRRTEGTPGTGTSKLQSLHVTFIFDSPSTSLTSIDSTDTPAHPANSPTKVDAYLGAYPLSPVSSIKRYLIAPRVSRSTARPRR